MHPTHPHLQLYSHSDQFVDDGHYPEQVDQGQENQIVEGDPVHLAQAQDLHLQIRLSELLF
jgi:hypothetical protein